MASQNLLKPQTHAYGDGIGGVDLYLTGASDIGKASKSLIIKTTVFDFNAQYPLIDATPESTSSASNTFYQKKRHTGRVQGPVNIKGFVIEGQAIGFANMPHEEIDVHVVLGEKISNGNTHSLKFRMAIEGISIQWSRQNVAVPIQIRGQITGTNAGATDVLPIVEATS